MCVRMRAFYLYACVNEYMFINVYSITLATLALPVPWINPRRHKEVDVTPSSFSGFFFCLPVECHQFLYSVPTILFTSP